MKKQKMGNPAHLRWIRHDVTRSALAASLKPLGVTDGPDDPVAWQLLTAGSRSLRPDTFSTAESFRQAYWSDEMWSKYPFALPGVDRTAAALQSFWDAERSCAFFNSELCEFFSRANVAPGFRQVMTRARAILHNLLGDIGITDIAEHARWGPGSSTSLPAKFASPATKWLFSHHVTLDAVPYVDAFSAWTGWVFRDPVVVPGNKVVFVAKNAKTERTIAIEPDWNMFFQLGLGRAIRARLRRVGMLLPEAQERHQALARRGSLDGFLATVDLKGASDSIPLALCEALLPECVLKHVLALRSPCGTLDEKTWFPYEKVSSMGNGFTFELETALFWALSKAVAGHASVYGDDIVVPSTCVGHLAAVFDLCGLTFNSKKSHYGERNPFRESCGGHYFKGVDVTPVYIRKDLTDVHRIATANELRKAIDDQHLPQLEAMWDAISRGIPRMFRGPKSIDGCLHVPPGGGAPRWVPALQSYRGLRLVKVYKTQRPLELGNLRRWLFDARVVRRRGLSRILFGDSRSRYEWEREAGRAVAEVREWTSDDPWSIS